MPRLGGANDGLNNVNGDNSGRAMTSGSGSSGSRSTTPRRRTRSRTKRSAASPSLSWSSFSASSRKLFLLLLNHMRNLMTSITTFARRRMKGGSSTPNALPKCNSRNVMLALMMLFVLRNILVQDYSQTTPETITTHTADDLRKRGYSEEQIARLQEDPRHKTQRRDLGPSMKRDEITALKRDVNFLLREVSDLRRRTVNGEEGGNDPPSTDDIQRELDILHMQKRRKREEKMGLHTDYADGLDWPVSDGDAHARDAGFREGSGERHGRNHERLKAARHGHFEKIGEKVDANTGGLGGVDTKQQGGEASAGGGGESVEEDEAEERRI